MGTGVPEWSSAPTSNAKQTNDLGAAEKLYGSTAVVIIVVANTSVIIYIAKNWKFRIYRNIPNLLVLFLAVTDLLTAIMGYPVRLASLFVASGQLIGGIPGCIFIHFSLTFLQTFSQCLVVVMSVERYISIKKPFLYEKHCRLGTCAALLVLLLAYAALVGAAGVSAQRVASMLYDRAFNLYCFPVNFPSILGTLVHLWMLFHGFVLLGIMFVCNVSVIRALRAMERKVALVCPKSKTEYLRQLDMISGMHRDFSRLMIAISCAFFCFMSPIQIRLLCNLLRIWQSMEADFAAWCMSLANAVINPLIYGLLRRRVRRKILKCINEALPCCRSIRVSHQAELEDDMNMNTYGVTM